MPVLWTRIRTSLMPTLGQRDVDELEARAGRGLDEGLHGGSVPRGRGTLQRGVASGGAWAAAFPRARAALPAGGRVPRGRSPRSPGRAPRCPRSPRSPRALAASSGARRVARGRRVPRGRSQRPRARAALPAVAAFPAGARSVLGRAPRCPRSPPSWVALSPCFRVDRRPIDDPGDRPRGSVVDPPTPLAPMGRQSPMGRRVADGPSSRRWAVVAPTSPGKSEMSDGCLTGTVSRAPRHRPRSDLARRLVGSWSMLERCVGSRRRSWRDAAGSHAR